MKLWLIFIPDYQLNHLLLLDLFSNVYLGVLMGGADCPDTKSLARTLFLKLYHDQEMVISVCT